VGGHDNEFVDSGLHVIGVSGKVGLPAVRPQRIKPTASERKLFKDVQVSGAGNEYL
jgi:hypothetical protein